MRKTTAVLFVALAATHAQAEFFTGNSLLSKMNGSSHDQVQAIGFMQGVYDVYTNVTFCPPDNVTAGQITDMGRNYLTNNPSQRHRTAERLMGDMFAQVWPCQQQQRAPGRGA